MRASCRTLQGDRRFRKRIAAVRSPSTNIRQGRGREARAARQISFDRPAAASSETRRWTNSCAHAPASRRGSRRSTRRTPAALAVGTSSAARRVIGLHPGSSRATDVCLSVTSIGWHMARERRRPPHRGHGGRATTPRARWHSPLLRPGRLRAGTAGSSSALCHSSQKGASPAGSTGKRSKDEVRTDQAQQRSQRIHATDGQHNRTYGRSEHGRQQWQRTEDPAREGPRTRRCRDDRASRPNEPRGVARVDDRRAIDGIFHILRAGPCPTRPREDLPRASARRRRRVDELLKPQFFINVYQ